MSRLNTSELYSEANLEVQSRGAFRFERQKTSAAFGPFDPILTDCYNSCVIIDFHTHIVPPYIIERREELVSKDDCFASLFSHPKAKLATADDLIESMDRDGIDVSVVTNMGWTSPGMCRETNDYIIESVNRYPDRLIGFGMVVPGSDVVSEIERCAGAGLRGIGEFMPHIQGFDIGDRELMESIMASVAEHNLIVLTHSTEPVGHVYPGKGNVFPGMLYRFITNFPDQRIVCAHWGGGLPFYALMPEVGEALKNVFFDTAATPFLYRYDIFAHVAEILGAEKVLFGSDYPLITQLRIIKGLESVSLSSHDKALILGENARRMLGLR